MHSVLKQRTCGIQWKALPKCVSAQFQNLHHHLAINNEKGVSKITLPGLGFEDFYASPDGRTYKPKLWRILNHIDFVREISFNDGYLDMKKLEETHFSYVKCASFQRVVNSRAFLELASKPYSFSLDIMISLGSMGKTSMQLDHLITDSNSVPLFESSMVSVFVNNITRKPTPPPEWWVNKYQSSVKPSPRLFLDHLEDKIATFQYPIVVGALDLDYYGHANNCSYVRFGAEALSAAFKGGQFDKKWQEEDIQSSLSRIENSFIRDCTMGDKLFANVWASHDHINCIIKNEQGQHIYHQKTELCGVDRKNAKL